MLYYLRLIIHSKHLNLYTLSLFSKIYERLIINEYVYVKRSAFMTGIIQIDNINHSQALIGNNDEHLKSIEEAFDVIIHARGQEIAVKGQVLEHVEKAELVLKIY